MHVGEHRFSIRLEISMMEEANTAFDTAYSCHRANTACSADIGKPGILLTVIMVTVE